MINNGVYGNVFKYSCIHGAVLEKFINVAHPLLLFAPGYYNFFGEQTRFGVLRFLPPSVDLPSFRFMRRDIPFRHAGICAANRLLEAIQFRLCIGSKY